jgi:signal transduction histidine kinase
VIAVKVQPDQMGVVLSVHDKGIGIAKEHQQRIFESFFQVESGPTRKAGGTGLGLAIAKKLTELHGGEIWVESEIGKGSTFFVQLPWEISAQPDLVQEK